jgi:pimeloyl-ACP methyl ester carboxylesterase
MPKLFVVGAKDFQFVGDARGLYRRAPTPKRLLVVRAGDHGVDLLDHAEVTRAIDDVLARAFK